MSKLIGKKITVQGYGQLRGQSEQVTVGRIHGTQVFLVMHDPETGSDYEVPFRLADGVPAGASPEGGFQIEADTLKQLKGDGGLKPQLTVVKGGKPEASSKKSTPATTPAKPAGKGTIMKKAVAKPAVKTAAQDTTKAKNGAAPAGTKAKVAEEPKKPAAAAKNGKPKTEPEPEPKKPATKAKATAPAAPAEEPKKTKAESKKPAAVEPDEDRELSPMEEADLLARQSRKPGEGETVIHVSPLMYRQMAWDELRPYPNGRRAPGFKEFREAMNTAQERSYVYLIVGEAAASYLVNTVFKNGFEGKWTGSMTGGFKRGAKRTAEQLAEEYGFELPEVIASHKSGKAEKEEAEKPAAKRGRKPAVEEDEEEEETTPAPKRPAKSGKPAAKTVKETPAPPVKKGTAPVKAAAGKPAGKPAVKKPGSRK